MIDLQTAGAVLGGAAGGMALTWGILRFIIDSALSRFELRLNDKYVTQSLCDARRGCGEAKHEPR